MGHNLRIEEMNDGLTARWRGLEKKRMFGGLCCLMKGNMCFGVHKDFLIVRMSPEDGDRNLKERRARPFDITGRPMKGWEVKGEKKAKAYRDRGSGSASRRR